MTADGSTIIEVIYSLSGGENCYISTDYGVTWAQMTSLGVYNWYSAKISDDGTIIYVGGEGGVLKKSADSGSTWVDLTVPWSGLSNITQCSGDGSQLLVSSDDVYKSLDGGDTWTSFGFSGSIRKALPTSDWAQAYIAEVGENFYITEDLIFSLISITPNEGTTAGGTSVTVTGTGFTESTTITLDGTPLNDLVFVDSETITGTTPSHPAGAVDVVAENP
jgi:hypothetical protein